MEARKKGQKGVDDEKFDNVSMNLYDMEAYISLA